MLKNNPVMVSMVLLIFVFFLGISLSATSYEFTEINCGNTSGPFDVGNIGTMGLNVSSAGEILLSYTHYSAASGGEYTPFYRDNKNYSLNVISFSVADAEVVSLNKNRQVVGNLYGRGFLGHVNGSVNYINYPNADRTQCITINDSGQILGIYTLASGPDSARPVSSVILGFVREPNGAFKSVDFPGWPRDMNNKGQIVGVSDDRGFIRQPDGSVSYFDAPGAFSTEPTGINDRGDIVGSYFDNSYSQHGFIFLAGSAPQTLDVNFPDSYGTGIMDINNLGQIVGYFATTVFSSEGTALNLFHGFLATPDEIQTKTLRQCQLRPGSTSSWKNDDYAHYSGSATICKKGCALTSLSMAFHALNVTQINLNPAGAAEWRPNDPGYLNRLLREHDGYDSNNDLKWSIAVAAVNKGLRSGLKFDTYSGRKSSLSDLNGALATLDNALIQRGVPVIVGVKLKKAVDPKVPGGYLIYPGHYVLVIGRESTSGSVRHLIVDPGSSPKQYLEEYNFVIDKAVSPEVIHTYSFPVFETRGSVCDPLDLSSISVTSDATAEVMLVSGSGYKTGFDPESGERLQEIPGSAYFIDSIDDNETGELAMNPSHMVILMEPAGGKYQLAVTGTKDGYFRVQADIVTVSGEAREPIIFEGVITPGTTRVFEISYSLPSPAEKLDALVAEVQESNINATLKTKLVHKLTIARNGIKRGVIAAVTTLLREVETTVSSKVGTSIPVDLALRWLGILEDVITTLTKM